MAPNSPVAGARVTVLGAVRRFGMLGWLGPTWTARPPPPGRRRTGPNRWPWVLTGRRDGSALVPPGQAASAVRGALRALELLTGVALPDSRVLSERAAIAGLRRDAPRSAGGALRVLHSADGWLRVNLAREAIAVAIGRRR